MEFGYARVSTAGQNLGRQIEALEQSGIDSRNIFADKVSGSTSSRPALDELMGKLREGDSVTVVSFDRLARSTRHLLTLADTFNEKGVNLRSLKEGVDTSTPHGRMVYTILGAVAEMERELIRENQAEGIALAKREGRMKGRPKVDQDSLEAALDLYRANTLSVSDIVRITGIGRSTLYREAAARGVEREK